MKNFKRFDCLKNYVSIIFISLTCFLHAPFLHAQTVSLNYPENGFVTASSSIELCWNYQSGNLYEIELADNAQFNLPVFNSSNLNSRKIIVPNLVTNTVYFWRVRIVSPLLSAWSNANTFTCFNPALLTNLNLWLRADTLLTLNNNEVVSWTDLSANQFVLTPPNAANQPDFNQSFCDNKKSVAFDGNDYFSISNFNFGASNTVFIIGKTNGGSVYSRYIGTYGNNMEICAEATGLSGNLLASYSTSNSSLLTVVRSPSVSSFLLNDSVLNSASLSIPPLAAGSLFVGTSNFQYTADFLIGEIAEVIISTSLLNDSLVSITNDYLMDKYAKVLSLGNDTIISDNFCPITLSASAGFSNYVWSTGETTATININQSGVYWLAAKDFFGRIKVDSIKVQYPLVNQLNSQALCVGNQLNWNTGLSSPYVHQWQDNSAANQIIITNGGNYYVKITDASGCTFYSDTAAIQLDTFSQSIGLGNDTSLCIGNSLQLMNDSVPVLSYLWSTGSFNDSITVTGAGQYWVEAGNINNCILRDTINIAITGIAPDAEFFAANGCEGLPVNFIDLSTAPVGENIIQWLWDFGDGTYSSTQNDLHNYDTSGTYSITLKVISQTGCGALYNQSVTVFPHPEINYTAFNLCNDKLTTFNNISNLYGGNQQSILWNFGDNLSPLNTADTDSASHIYTVAGNYTIKLTIETNEGCIDSIQRSLLIKPAPVADFATVHQCVGDSTQFNDISQIEFPWQNLNRTWYFPNGDTSLAFQPLYRFDTASVYTVSLLVQATNGCRDTIAKTITIYNYPDADFTFEKNCIGNPALFSDTSACVNCSIVNYLWQINNSAVGTGRELNYVFSDTGNFVVNLTVTNNAGCASDKDTVLTVSPAPLSGFTINSAFGSPPFTAEFNNTSTYATSYFWDFGDGTFSEEFNPSHLYTDTGTFTVNLKVINDDDCESNSSQTIKLYPKKIDLVLHDVKSELADGYIETEIIVFNRSTAVISGFEIIIGNNANIVAKENYTALIVPGEFKTLKLITKIKQGEEYNLTDVICVELINIIEGADSDISNNKKCIALADENFKLLTVFPNPTKGAVYLNFICPARDEITIEVVDLIGKSLFKKVISTEPGYNQYSIPSHFLAAGSNICNLTYKGTTHSILFIKLNEDE